MFRPNKGKCQCLNLGQVKVNKEVLDRINTILSGFNGYYTTSSENMIIDLDELRQPEYEELLEKVDDVLLGIITIPKDNSGILNYLELHP